MQDSIVFTVIGTDRAGLVEQLSRVLVAHQANWLESRMARLSGQFAGIVHATVPRARREALARALADLAEQGLQVQLAGGSDEQADAGDLLLHLEFIGPDRVGIVHEVSAALARRQVNIDELISETVSASWSGEQLFKADAEVRVRAGTDLDELRASLDAVADELMLDIIIEPRH